MKKAKFSAYHAMMDEWIAEFGKRVEFLRKELASKTQTDIADAADLNSPNVLVRIEKGASRRINLYLLRVLVQLANQHGRDADWLFLGDVSSPEDRVERLAKATREELLGELLNLAQDRTLIDEFLRHVDDPAAREALAKAFKKPQGGR